MNPSSSILYPTEVESLRQQLVERDAELRRINHAINDPRVDLTITATEAITDLRYKLGVVSSLLREASGRSSYGNWSTEFRTNVEKALAASDVDIEWLKGMVDEIHAARKVVNQHDKLLVEIAGLHKQLADLNHPVVLSEWQQLQQENNQLRQQVTLLLEAIKIAEWGSWSNQVAFDESSDCCPVCGNLKKEGHEMLCQIKVAFAATEPNP